MLHQLLGSQSHNTTESAGMGMEESDEQEITAYQVHTLSVV
jgi:hypothetical protein